MLVIQAVSNLTMVDGYHCYIIPNLTAGKFFPFMRKNVSFLTDSWSLIDKIPDFARLILIFFATDL